MRRITRGLAGTFLLTVFLATPVLAQTYPPDEPTAEVSDSTVRPCSTITVTGSNWEAGSSVRITLDADQLATDTADAGGNVSTPVRIPCALAPGTYVLGISGTAADGTAATATTIITVLGAVGGAGAPGTGANLGAGILILGALLVLGVTSLVATRKRVVAQPQHVAETRPL
jgi:hypothetical protein